MGRVRGSGAAVAVGGRAARVLQGRYVLAGEVAASDGAADGESQHVHGVVDMAFPKRITVRIYEWFKHKHCVIIVFFNCFFDSFRCV